jgi:uncharacterized membrane protein YbhN (UPF0104 family)
MAALIGMAIGIEAPIYFFIIAVSVLALADIIPLSIGGLGTREAGAIVLFSAIGVNAELAVAFSIAYFLVGYGVPAVVGGLLFLKKPIS